MNCGKIIIGLCLMILCANVMMSSPLSILNHYDEKIEGNFIDLILFFIDINYDRNII